MHIDGRAVCFILSWRELYSDNRETFGLNESYFRKEPECLGNIDTHPIINRRIGLVDELETVVNRGVYESGFHDEIGRGEYLHVGNERHRTGLEGMTDTPHNSRDGRKDLGGFYILSDFGLDGLVQLDVPEQSGLGVGLELLILEILEGLLGDLVGTLDGIELQVLEIVGVCLEGPEGDLKFGGDVGPEEGSLRVDVENCHVLAVQVLLLLGHPENAQLGLQPVDNLYFPLSTQSHHVAEAELDEVLAHSHQLAPGVLEKQLLLQDVRMLLDQGTRLVQVRLGGCVLLLHLSSPCQFEQDVVLDILQLNLRNPTLDHSFPESVHVHLGERQWLYQQVETSPHQVHIQQRVVSHQTVDPFIVRNRVPGSKLDHYFLVTILLNVSFRLVEAEDISGIHEELELGIRVGVIVEC